jgi:hypothetical protein
LKTIRQLDIPITANGSGFRDFHFNPEINIRDHWWRVTEWRAGWKHSKRPSVKQTFGFDCWPEEHI